MADNSGIILRMGLTGAIAIAAALVIPFEGIHHDAYLDPPGIPTICYGHAAKDVHLGQHANDEQCIRLLQKDLDNANAVVNRYVKVQMPDTRRAALIDFVYNIGEGKFSRSTLLRLLNDGRTKEACEQLKLWVNSNGHKLDGLVKRREAERVLCVDGL